MATFRYFTQRASSIVTLLKAAFGRVEQFLRSQFVQQNVIQRRLDFENVGVVRTLLQRRRFGQRVLCAPRQRSERSAEP